MDKELEDKVDALILAAAKKELHWNAGDFRHDHEQWKRDLLKRLWEELDVDYELYT